MLKRLITLAITWLFSFSALAQPSTVEGLKTALDEFNYAVYVERDQQELAFYDSQLNLLTQRITELRRQGMSDRELWTEALKMHADKQSVQVLDEIFRRFESGELSGDVTQQLLLQLAQGSQTQGAAWAGGIAEAITFSFFFLVVVVLTSGTCEKDSGDNFFVPTN